MMLMMVANRVTPAGLTRRVWLLAAAGAAASPVLPDDLLSEAYAKAGEQNVLAAVNPRVFPGYFSVCADGQGFGYGNTYPSLDGHQMTDALLWLGDVHTARLNFDYVRRFQLEDGRLPLAILPESAGKDIGPRGYTSRVADNGGLYQHWVPGNPLDALASPTYLQNADVIYRRTLDREWLSAQIGSINRSAEYLAGLTGSDGAVGGSGYYIERPVRLGCDGVTQPHAVDAFRRAAALNRVHGDRDRSRRYDALAAKVQRSFQKHFWMGDHFAEYRHPERGFIDRHGLSDANWAALAFGVASPPQRRMLWARIRSAPGFYYGGMPTGVVTDPASYEGWEFSYPDRMDLAAMGRVWYLEAAARARMGDAAGLLDTILRVCRAGRASGYFWRERYGKDGGYGAQKYCEYPANLIRVVQRFLFGVELALDGTIVLAPVVTPDFFARGFGQRIEWRGRVLEYRFRNRGVTGTYRGAGSQQLAVQTAPGKWRRLLLAGSAQSREWSV
jgi:hypothetical protein